MELPKRKPTRLRNYDYSTPGAYFVTICAQNRRCVFSDIILGTIHESPEKACVYIKFSTLYNRVRAKPSRNFAFCILHSALKRITLAVVLFFCSFSGNPGEGSLRKTIHRIVLLPSCAFLSIGVSHSAECDRGFAPCPHKLLKKFDQNFIGWIFCEFYVKIFFTAVMK